VTSALRFPAWTICLFLLSTVQSQALSIQGYSAEVHDRFSSGYPTTPVPNASVNFIGKDFDWSGVGWDASNSARSVTLINSSHFVGAYHFSPSIGATINFFDPATATILSRTVTSYIDLTDPFDDGITQRTDLRVGVLSAPLPPSIATYPILTLNTLGDYVNLDILTYGQSARIGTNTIDGFASINMYNGNGTPLDASDDFVQLPSAESPVVADGFILTFDQDMSTGESVAQFGDSGSPTFVPWGGGLALVSIHSAVGGLTTIDTFIPAYLDQFDSNSIVYTTVPEPASLPLLMLSLFIWLMLMSRKGPQAGLSRRCGKA